MMTRYRAHPGVQPVLVVFRLGPEPLTFDNAVKQGLAPEHHAQRVVANTVVRQPGLPPAQGQHGFRALALERFGELAQVMQRQPEADPIDDRLFTRPDCRRKPASQAGCAIQEDTACRRDIEAVIGQQVMGRSRIIRRPGLAPIPVETWHAHAGSPPGAKGRAQDSFGLQARLVGIRHLRLR